MHFIESTIIKINLIFILIVRGFFFFCGVSSVSWFMERKPTRVCESKCWWSCLRWCWWRWGAPLQRLLPLVIRLPVHNHCARTFSIDFPCDAAQLESFEYGAHVRARSVWNPARNAAANAVQLVSYTHICKWTEPTAGAKRIAITNGTQKKKKNFYIYRVTCALMEAKRQHFVLDLSSI